MVQKALRLPPSRETILLQIIGFLGCFMIIIKALEIVHSGDFRDETGLREGALWTAVVAGVGACLFALWLYAQGPSFQQPAQPSLSLPELTPSQVECISAAKTNEEVIACSP